MISAPAIARQISDLMIEFGGRLDAFIALVQSNCPEEEFLAYRHQVANIMGDRLTPL